MSEDPNHTSAGSVLSRVSARMSAMSPEGESDGEAPIDTSAATEPAPVANGEPSAVEQLTSTPEQLATMKRAQLEEKLAEARAKNTARRLEKQLQVRSKAAEDDRKAARAEREKFEASNRKLREGSFKDALTELGRDPRKAFEEMQREAVEAGSPEGQIRLLQRQLEETAAKNAAELEEIRKAREADAAERAKERDQVAEQLLVARFQNDFVKTLQDPAFNVLREAYDDEVIYAFADDFRLHPEKLHATAREHAVRLTQPGGRFTMREILKVLKTAQENHDARRQERRAGLGGVSQTLSRGTTVNGTTEKRNAGTTVGNDLASARASDGRAKLSRAERIEQEIRRQEGR